MSFATVRYDDAVYLLLLALLVMPIAQPLQAWLNTLLEGRARRRALARLDSYAAELAADLRALERQP